MLTEALADLIRERWPQAEVVVDLASCVFIYPPGSEGPTQWQWFAYIITDGDHLTFITYQAACWVCLEWCDPELLEKFFKTLSETLDNEPLMKFVTSHV